MNLALIGMPGAGKSTVGRLLADELGYSLIDSDALLEQKWHKPLGGILEELGETEFVREEAETLRLALDNKDEQVVAPGGSIIYNEQMMTLLHGLTTVVYLQVRLSAIETRLGQSLQGVVGIGTKTLEEIYNERTPLYERHAHIVVDGEHGPALVVDNIKKELSGL